MNLVDYEQTSVAQVFEAVSREAAKLGIEVAGAEIVGLLPGVALDRTAAYFPFLEDFRESLVLENLLLSSESRRK